MIINNEWNAAITMAIKSVNEAPIFTKKDMGPQKDAEKIIMLDIIIKRLEALKKC